MGGGQHYVKGGHRQVLMERRQGATANQGEQLTKSLHAAIEVKLDESKKPDLVRYKASRQVCLANKTIAIIDVDNNGQHKVIWRNEDVLPRYGLSKDELQAVVDERARKLQG